MKKNSTTTMKAGLVAVCAALLLNLGCLAEAGAFGGSPELMAQRALEHGKVAARMGNEQEARASFEAARENYAQAMQGCQAGKDCCMGYAQASLLTGNYAEAATACEKIISGNRAVDATCAYAIAGAAYAALGDADKAAQMLDAVISVEGFDAVAIAARQQGAALRAGTADAASVIEAIESAMRAQSVKHALFREGRA